ncbi:AAA family ATPase [Nannocystis sp. RBIL2]|uniref:ATP-binding protein n=1 Tax=Nannocystis sp. RBIL2 TaxID=2996788 RepID=UPI002271A96E|nr:AAA family ATPase [Nannocystis sp. RBIL2]MCY1063653.1 AAA family ATPase [Nannocystis sp. RBIL2]
MTRSRPELERALAEDPFDLATRKEYARALEDDGQAAAALRQWELVCRQQPDSAAGFLGAMRCHRALGALERAEACLREAEAKQDFSPEIRPARPAPALQVLTGGGDVRPAAVVPLRPAAVRFDDVIGHAALKKTLEVRIIAPFVRPGLFARFGKRAGGGVLLYGPPGCGKTMIARAIASECRASFIAVGISEILDMWLGRSERNLAAAFDRAREQRPAVLFFDELDALAFSRSKAHTDHTRTLVNEFLNQLDGVAHDNQGVLVLGATNMPWDVDPAMKRPGRFDRQVFVPPPDDDARAEMFRVKLADAPTGPIDVLRVARATPHCSGADVDGVIEAAKERVLTEILAGGPERPIAESDLLAAAKEVQPSTLEWLRTARNLVKYAGDGSYRDVEDYLKSARLL